MSNAFSSLTHLFQTPEETCLDSEGVPDDSAIIQMHMKRDDPPLTVEWQWASPGCLAKPPTVEHMLVLCVFDARATLLSISQKRSFGELVLDHPCQMAQCMESLVLMESPPACSVCSVSFVP